VLTEIAGTAPADLLWTLEPTADPARWLVGTGPEGRIFELALDAGANAFTSREIAKLDDPQVFALKRLPDGAVLAGTSPKGGLWLIRDGQAVARVALPVDSIFDLLPVDARTVLVATGNPGKIYRVDLEKFAAAGLNPEKTSDAAVLASRGIALFGEIRDRNVRRLAALADGRIAAGSAPKGNLYAFPPEGGAPVILQENRDAEVTDLLPQPDGDLFATIVYSTNTADIRLAPPGAAPKAAKAETPPPPAVAERFAGRSALVRFPADGFPETLASRANTAFYRVVRRGDLLLLAGGELGELLGYDLKSRLAVTFAGSGSAQLNHLAPLAGSPDRFLVLRNNTPGLAVLDFAAAGPREAETRRIDLGTPARVGALRFNRLRELSETALSADIRLSNGTDEVEGWTPWTPLALGADGGRRADALRGRYAKLRLRIPDPAPAGFEIDRADLFALPQNRRPALQDFRLLTPGFGVVPAVEQPPAPVVSLSQLAGPRKDDETRRALSPNSQVVPSPGTRVVLWTLSDADGDAFVNTFSIRREGETAWTDLVTASRETFAQFDTKNLPDGIYFTRLVVTETAPRPPAERLTHTFETDDLIVDHTAPELTEATAVRTADAVVLTVRGRDRLSLLDGIEAVFSNGLRETVEQPADGIRDGREETFVLELPLARVSNATSVEVTLYDAAGNGTAKRLAW
jgi:hypothetical protein